MDQHESSDKEDAETTEYMECKKGETVLAKDLGNKAFHEGHVSEAMEHWNRGVRTYQYVLAKDVYDGEEKERIRKELCILYANLGAGHLRCHEYHSCVEMCSKALKLDPCCIKALYRKAMSFFHLSRYTQAVETLNHLLALQPDSHCARVLKQQCQAACRQSRVKEKRIMKKFFQESFQPSPHGSSYLSRWYPKCSCPRRSCWAEKRWNVGLIQWITRNLCFPKILSGWPFTIFYKTHVE